MAKKSHKNLVGIVGPRIPAIEATRQHRDSSDPVVISALVADSNAATCMLTVWHWLHWLQFWRCCCQLIEDALAVKGNNADTSSYLFKRK